MYTNSKKRKRESQCAFDSQTITHLFKKFKHNEHEQEPKNDEGLSTNDATMHDEQSFLMTCEEVREV